MEYTFTLENIATVAKEIYEKYRQHTVWAFINTPMGAGKTTFIKTLCQEVLQIKDTAGSPTFSIINEYHSPVAGKIYHLDLYRLKDEEEAIQAGVEDVLYSGNFCLVEWAGIAEHLLPEYTLYIDINIIDNTTRQLMVTAL